MALHIRWCRRRHEKRENLHAAQELAHDACDKRRVHQLCAPIAARRHVPKEERSLLILKSRITQYLTIFLLKIANTDHGFWVFRQ